MADVNIPKERADLALRVSYEVDTLADAFAHLVDEVDDQVTEYLLPVLLRRLKDINSVAMSVLGGDDGRTTKEMFEVIYGEGTMPMPGTTDADSPASSARLAAVLFEHDDGRYRVAGSAEDADFARNDPAWHRVGPVDVSALGEVSHV